MQWSDQLDKIAPAYVKAQAECQSAKKSSTNPAFKSKYADLAAVWSACEDVLPANDLSVFQGLGEAIEGRMHMDTMLLHSSGQFILAHSSIPMGKVDPQGYGSATTYLRRYALAAAMGIIQEDDDGNAATKAPAPQMAKITDAQFAELATLAEQSGADLKVMCSYYKIAALCDLPATNFEHARTQLANKLQKKAS